MSQQQSNRNGRTIGLGAFVALSMLFLGAAGAQAQRVTTWPGTACQATGSAQDLYYDGQGTVIANRGDGLNSAVCPIARSNPLQPWRTVVVFVRDRHSTQDVTCTARARDLYATSGVGWSETKSTSGEGFQALVFGVPGGSVPAYGPYSVVCQLPAMEETNQPSYITSYLIVEP
jgi:hypothetical protein